MILCYLLFVPFVGAVYAVSRSEAAVWYFGITWLLLCAVSVGVVGVSRCPRCGHTFHLTAILANPFTRRCLHCSLSLD